MLSSKPCTGIVVALFALLTSGHIHAIENGIETKPEIENHFLDLGVGIGLDYGGLPGVKLAYITPFPHVSVFGSAGYYLLGVGWAAGATFHILPQSSRFVFRPNLKIMYGTNRATKVVGASKYDKIFTGFTPGIGFEVMFGSKKSNGFDIDLNFPIKTREFEDHLNRIKADPFVEMGADLPFAISMGYHHEF